MNGHAAMAFQPGKVRVRKADGSHVLAEWAIVDTVGPASYSTGGIPVDCSEFFSSILMAYVARCFVTSTETEVGTRPSGIAQTAPDVFSSAKFRILCFAQTASHTHTYDKTDTPTATANSGVVGADPHSHALTYTSTASGATASTTRVEIGAGTNLSTTTYSTLVLGVPIA